MSYEKIMERLAASRARMSEHLKKVEEERQKQTKLLAKLGDTASSVTGETIVIRKNNNHDPNYNRSEILSRVITLREEENKSYAAIAAILNAEGYKPRTAKSFSQATVFQLYNGAVKSVEFAVAAIV